MKTVERFFKLAAETPQVKAPVPGAANSKPLQAPKGPSLSDNPFSDYKPGPSRALIGNKLPQPVSPMSTAARFAAPGSPGQSAPGRNWVDPAASVIAGLPGLASPWLPVSTGSSAADSVVGGSIAANAPNLVSPLAQIGARAPLAARLSRGLSPLVNLSGGAATPAGSAARLGQLGRGGGAGYGAFTLGDAAYEAVYGIPSGNTDLKQLNRDALGQNYAQNAMTNLGRPGRSIIEAINTGGGFNMQGGGYEGNLMNTGLKAYGDSMKLDRQREALLEARRNNPNGWWNQQ